MISFREIANQIDGFDGEIQRITDMRKEFWAEVREVIPARDVKALKDAIKARRKRKADRDGEEAYEARVAEILDEIERGTEIATRARAPRESVTGLSEGDLHNIYTGEITECALQLPPQEADARATGRGGLSAVGPASGPFTNETAPVSGDAGETTGEAARHKSGASPTICEECHDTGILDLGDGAIVCPCREFSGGSQITLTDRTHANITGVSVHSEIHREPSNRDVSTDGKASSAAASQGQAAHAGKGDSTGEGAGASSPNFLDLTIPEFLRRAS